MGSSRLAPMSSRLARLLKHAALVSARRWRRGKAQTVAAAQFSAFLASEHRLGTCSKIDRALLTGSSVASPNLTQCLQTCPKLGQTRTKFVLIWVKLLPPPPRFEHDSLEHINALRVYRGDGFRSGVAAGIWLVGPVGSMRCSGRLLSGALRSSRAPPARDSCRGPPQDRATGVHRRPEAARPSRMLGSACGAVARLPRRECPLCGTPKPKNASAAWASAAGARAFGRTWS